MVLVYTDHKSSRIDYIFHLILKEIAGLKYQITNDFEDFISFDGPKFSYGFKSFESVIHIQAFGLLHETGIHQFQVSTIEYEGVNCPFVTERSSLFPFDIFSASFYLVSRYEEYLATEKDGHGRFVGRSSLAYQKGFLDKSVVDRWALLLRDKLSAFFPSLTHSNSNYSSAVTIDIDQAYSYRGKGRLRNIGGLINDLKNGRLRRVVERLSVVFLGKKDPFDTFQYMMTYKQRVDIPFVFFLHLGDRGKYDKSLRWNHSLMKKLVQRLSSIGVLGIHPSYISSSSGVLHEECERFNKLLHHFPKRSRQHYLKISFPETYRLLIREGISTDYTMGYDNVLGFRASTCTPFLFYDLQNETETALRIYPFIAMDVTMKNYLRLSIKESQDRIEHLKKEVKSVGGFFSIVWHNESLSNVGEWKNWRTVFESAYN